MTHQRNNRDTSVCPTIRLYGNRRSRQTFEGVTNHKYFNSASKNGNALRASTKTKVEYTIQSSVGMEHVWIMTLMLTLLLNRYIYYTCMR